MEITQLQSLELGFEASLGESMRKRAQMRKFDSKKKNPGKKNSNAGIDEYQSVKCFGTKIDRNGPNKSRSSDKD